jgi:LacI family transcriptional regulator
VVEKKLTIRDIARLAGVSRSTVSLVINDDRRISDETRRRVQDIIRKSGYEPNVLARGLARRRAGVIAVNVPRVASHVFSDYYFSEAISGIGDTLAAHGDRMLIEMVSDQYIQDGAHLKLFREGRIDGMLLVGTLTTDSYILDLARLYRVLLVNSSMEGVPGVRADNYQGALEMMRHLVSLGHRRIGFISGIEITTVGFDRSRGFRDGAKEAGLSLSPDLCLDGNFSEESGHQAGARFLDLPARPTAIFAANDMMAIGCLKAAAERGLSIPRDLTIVGGDDVTLASYVRPRLTTIRQPMFDIGREATEALFQLPSWRDRRPVAPDGRMPPAPTKVIPTELVVRESSGPPP